MSDFQTEFGDAKVFAGAMAKGPGVIREELLTSTDRLTLQGAGFAQRKVHVISGHLRRSIANKPATFAGGTVTGSFGTAVPYARMEEFGGTIRAKNKPYLVFMGRDGHLVKVKSVTRRGHPFMGVALRALRPMVKREYAAGLQRAMKRIGLP